jgi:hypothetical protein
MAEDDMPTHFKVIIIGGGLAGESIYGVIFNRPGVAGVVL